jgi:hypothetical protein
VINSVSTEVFVNVSFVKPQRNAAVIRNVKLMAVPLHVQTCLQRVSSQLRAPPTSVLFWTISARQSAGTVSLLQASEGRYRRRWVEIIHALNVLPRDNTSHRRRSCASVNYMRVTFDIYDVSEGFTLPFAVRRVLSCKSDGCSTVQLYVIRNGLSV